MKRLLLAALLVVSASASAYNPFSNVPGYGQYAEAKGNILTCPVPYGNHAYHYWFAMGRGTNVRISRVGYPGGAQVFAYVQDGSAIPGGYDLLLRTEEGRQLRVRWQGRHGFIDDGSQQIECNVSDTDFVM